jgi:predicted PilT family ATPase
MRNDGFKLKFLITNSVASIIIGKGGENIRALSENTNTRVRVSSAHEVFPGTRHRICEITGPDYAVVLAQSIIWEIIAIDCHEPNDHDTYTPSTKPSHRYDRCRVEGTISIPATTAGYIIGRHGASIREISEKSGATFMMSTKEEATESQERVITVCGFTAQCFTFVALIIAKLADASDSAYTFDCGLYHQHTTSLIGRRVVTGIEGSDVSDETPTSSSRSTSRTHTENQETDRRGHGRFRGKLGGRLGRAVSETTPESTGTGESHASSRVRGSVPQDSYYGVEVLSATTTYSLAVKDKLVGAILGTKGTHLRDIMGKSGAVVSCSEKGEFVRGTDNRVVTVAGNPQSALLACELISQKLHDEH